MAIYQDRRDGGQKLADDLSHYAGRSDVIVLGLPRGGVPVAYEVAHTLGVPLDVFLVRKLGVPGHEELAMGAIASGDVRVLNGDVVRKLNVSDETIDALADEERKELRRREQTYRGDRSLPDLSGRTVILVDDGLATGATMRAAVAGVRAHEPAEIVVAVPTAAPETCADLQNEDDVDTIICAETPQPFFGVGAWYRDFSQTTDDEVRDLLEKAHERATVEI